MSGNDFDRLTASPESVSGRVQNLPRILTISHLHEESSVFLNTNIEVWLLVFHKVKHNESPRPCTHAND